MAEQLKVVLEDNKLSTVAVNKAILDAETKRRLQSLGYLSSETVDENIQFDQKTTNPKKLINVYNSFEKMLTLLASGKYHKAKKICNKMLKKWPDMRQMHFHLGGIALAEQDTQGIIRHYSKYLADNDPDSNKSKTPRIKPAYATVHSNLGAALAHEGRIVEAMEHYKKALAFDPYSAKAIHNLAGVYLRQGKIADATAYYERTLDLDPEMPQANHMMGIIRLNQGHFDSAIRYFNKALEAMSDPQETQKALSTARQQMQKAIVSWDKSLQSNPNQPELYNNLGRAFYQLGDVKAAVYQWTKALEIKPDWLGVLNSLAWAKATHPSKEIKDPKQAVTLAERACELTSYKNPQILDTLATAYASANSFDKAIETAQRALILAQAADRRQLTNDIKDRLVLYKKGQSYVDLAHAPESSDK